MLQTKLCETYNSRLTYDSSGETDAEEEEEAGKKDEAKKMPVVVGLGVKGVFTIVRDIWHTHPELCLRALKEFLNILQGQSPAGLKNEPYESTGNLCVLSSNHLHVHVAVMCITYHNFASFLCPLMLAQLTFVVYF